MLQLSEDGSFRACAEACTLEMDIKPPEAVREKTEIRKQKKNVCNMFETTLKTGMFLKRFENLVTT